MDSTQYNPFKSSSSTNWSHRAQEKAEPKDNKEVGETVFKQVASLCNSFGPEKVAAYMGGLKISIIEMKENRDKFSEKEIKQIHAGLLKFNKKIWFQDPLNKTCERWYAVIQGKPQTTEEKDNKTEVLPNDFKKETEEINTPSPRVSAEIETIKDKENLIDFETNASLAAKRIADLNEHLQNLITNYGSTVALIAVTTLKPSVVERQKKAWGIYPNEIQAIVDKASSIDQHDEPIKQTRNMIRNKKLNWGMSTEVERIYNSKIKEFKMKIELCKIPYSPSLDGYNQEELSNEETDTDSIEQKIEHRRDLLELLDD